MNFPSIVLVDGKWVGYRMHFAHMGLKTSDGKPTGMMHGFLHELLRINRKLPEAGIIICWDGKGPTWRHKLYPSYKKNRQLNPEMQKVHEGSDVLIPLLRKLGFWVLKKDGVEADDMIGMASHRLNCEGYPVRIHSSDQDMLQLVRADQIVIWSDLKQPVIQEKDVKKIMGVEPWFVSEIRALAGDSSDNLKGLPGIGLKKALRLWKEGFRISLSALTYRNRNQREMFGKYEKDWFRVKKEFECAQIVKDPATSLFSEELQVYLSDLMEEVSKNPFRDKEKAERNREEVYRILVRYELEQVLAERHALFAIP